MSCNWHHKDPTWHHFDPPGRSFLLKNAWKNKVFWTCPISIFGTILAPNLAPMEPSWGHLGGMLGPYEAILEALGAILGSPGAILGTLWAILEPPGGFLEPPCGFLGASCGHLEASWAIWRPPEGDLGPILPHLGSNLDHFRSLLVSISTYSRPNFRPQRLLCIYVYVFVLLHLAVIFIQ